jgi:hypothetical protein
VSKRRVTPLPWTVVVVDTTEFCSRADARAPMHYVTRTGPTPAGRRIIGRLLRSHLPRRAAGASGGDVLALLDTGTRGSPPRTSTRCPARPVS